ncbi:MAG: hypothetical protein ABIK31_02735 [candidate division WOR-3 bacterium]
MKLEKPLDNNTNYCGHLFEAVNLVKTVYNCYLENIKLRNLLRQDKSDNQSFIRILKEQLAEKIKEIF